MAVIPSYRLNGVGILPAGTDTPAGSGTAEAGIGGVLTVSTTTAQTGANTTETDLWTYSLPANTLSADNYGVRITVYGTFAANANGKKVGLNFGASILNNLDAVQVNGVSWRMVFDVTRTGASAQVAMGERIESSQPRAVAVSTPAADTTAAITIKVTGQNSVASAGDIVFRYARVDFLRPGS